jgi:hypothetical protein
MYDPHIGKWLSEDPKSFGAQDANLYRMVGNDVTNATDPSGLEARSVAMKFEREYEGVGGLAVAIENKTMVSKEILVERGAKDKVRIEFVKAYEGKYIRNGVPWSGVYVRIEAELMSSEFDDVKLVQITTETKMMTPNDGGAPRPVAYFEEEYLTQAQKIVAGWSVKGINFPQHYQGWRIDLNSLDNTTPFQNRENKQNGFDGSSRLLMIGQSAPIYKDNAYLWDTPSRGPALTNSGNHFLTCAIGYKDGVATFLGAVFWGYYVDAEGNAKFTMPIPVKLQTAPPPELAAALNRWNRVNGKEKLIPVNMKVANIPSEIEQKTGFAPTDGILKK